MAAQTAARHGPCGAASSPAAPAVREWPPCHGPCLRARLQHLVECALAGFLRLAQGAPGRRHLVHDLLEWSSELIRGEVLYRRIPHRCSAVELVAEKGHDVLGKRLALAIDQCRGQKIARHLQVRWQVGKVAEPGLDAHTAHVVEPGEGLLHMPGTLGERHPVWPVSRDDLGPTGTNR